MTDIQITHAAELKTHPGQPRPIPPRIYLKCGRNERHH